MRPSLAAALFVSLVLLVCTPRPDVEDAGTGGGTAGGGIAGGGVAVARGGEAGGSAGGSGAAGGLPGGGPGGAGGSVGGGGGGPGNCVNTTSATPLHGCVFPDCDTGNIRYLTLSYFDGGSCGLPQVVELALTRSTSCSPSCSVHLVGMQTAHYFESGQCFWWWETLTVNLTFADGGLTGSGTSLGTGEGSCYGQVAIIDAGP
jgi:hypothetical protein